jgi:hypothetical protein
MDTSVAQDKKLDSKLNTVGSLLPMKLRAFFQAIEKKTHAIAEDVANFRQKQVLAKDIVKPLRVVGSDPIPMSQSLSASEGNIVQFIVLLDRHLPHVRSLRMSQILVSYILSLRNLTPPYKFVFYLIDANPFRVVLVLFQSHPSARCAFRKSCWHKVRSCFVKYL